MRLYENKENMFVHKYKELDIANLTEEELIITYAFQLAILRHAEYNSLLCRYNFGNYGEQLVNIYKNGKLWEVSVGVKRKSSNKKVFYSCLLAYMYALNLLTDDKKELQRLHFYFDYYLMKDYTREQLGNFNSLYILSDDDRSELIKKDSTEEHYDKVRKIRRRILPKYES